MSIGSVVMFLSTDANGKYVVRLSAPETGKTLNTVQATCDMAAQRASDSVPLMDMGPLPFVDVKLDPASPAIHDEIVRDFERTVRIFETRRANIALDSAAQMRCDVS